MEITHWLPAVTTTSLFGVITWLFRSLIITRLTKTVQSQFDVKLENLKSELREKEVKTQSSLKSKEDTIEKHRTGAMSAFMVRQEKLYEKQLLAIDQVWESLLELNKAKYICMNMGIVNFEYSAKEAPKNPKLRDFFTMISGDVDIKKLNLSPANKARPFLSSMAWAYYNAYRSIVTLSIFKLETLKIGVESPEKYLKLNGITELLKIVLPHQADYLEKYGHEVHHNLLDEIEELLLSELKNMKNGINTDEDNVKRAGAIIKASDSMVEKTMSEIEETEL